MTVSELIDFLKTQPQNALVAYELFGLTGYSDQCLLDVADIKLYEFCEPRSDGWIQSKRPDMPSRQYLVFPGN